MYVDGHERADVVLDRVRYIAEVHRFLPRMDQYGGSSMDEVTPRITWSDARSCGSTYIVVFLRGGENKQQGKQRTHQKKIQNQQKIQMVLKIKNPLFFRVLVEPWTCLANSPSPLFDLNQTKLG